MTTLADLIEEVQDALHLTHQERCTYLTGPITETDTGFSVMHEDMLNRGVYEIDDELVYVVSVDRGSAKTATILPSGRGYRGTTAAAHAEGAKVTINPVLSRKRITDYLNQTITSAYPTVFEVATESFGYQAARVRYALPADADSVLRVSWQAVGPSDEQIPVRRWRENQRTDGLSVEVFSPITPGQSVDVVYRKKPSQFTASTESLADIGMPEASRDILVAGATARAVGVFEPSRLHTDAVEASQRAVEVPVGASPQAAQFYWRVYNQRLQEEADQLRRRYQPQIHYTR